LRDVNIAGAAKEWAQARRVPDRRKESPAEKTSEKPFAHLLFPTPPSPPLLAAERDPRKEGLRNEIRSALLSNDEKRNQEVKV
jgi:hypothetical protein